MMMTMCVSELNAVRQKTMALERDFVKAQKVKLLLVCVAAVVALSHPTGQTEAIDGITALQSNLMFYLSSNVLHLWLNVCFLVSFSGSEQK